MITETGRGRGPRCGLLRESGKELGQVTIVNGDAKLGYETAARLMTGLGQDLDPAPPVTFPGGFRDFIARHDLDEFQSGL